MAKKKAPKQNTSNVSTNSFNKGMIKDIHGSVQPSTNWSHARNAMNHSGDGDLSVIGNEPANLECAKVPYTIIGAIHTYGDEWVLYSTDNVNSEIGLFDDSKCEYKPLVNDPCLSFKTSHLIVGAAKENYDCSWQVYWDDALNPSRTLNLDDIPYKRVITSNPSADCVEYTDLNELDCEKLRLAPLLSTPCISIKKSEDGGQLRNGMYQVYIAYVVNEQRVTDYIGVSNQQSLWEHAGTGGALDIKITNLDEDQFEYYELVILSNNQNNLVAKKLGIYSTQQKSIGIDFIDPSLISIPVEFIPLRTPAYEKSDAMYVVNDYLIRKGPTTQFDFNYQPIANNIVTNWVIKEYPAAYYSKGGNQVGFMRDEQYAFFIRWIYNTGERSSSYHIPGRAPKTNGTTQTGSIVNETAVFGGQNALSSEEYGFQVFNTATTTQTSINTPDTDGGIILAKGEMGYWESTERYPATRPDIWGNLCGLPIRHHKMPTEELHPNLKLTNNDGTSIRILGVEFSNIERPKDNDGLYIENIVGYEILRGSREGAKSILAKGMFKNMRKYNIPDADDLINANTQGLYPNYPFNDLRDDWFHIDSNEHPEGNSTYGSTKSNYSSLSGYTKDVFTFHSPDLNFRKPFLNAYETRFYGEIHGAMTGSFKHSENHPRFKLLKNAAAVIAGIVGVGYAIGAVRGNESYRLRGSSNHMTSIKPDAFAIVMPTPGGGSVLGSGYAETALETAAGAGIAALGQLGEVLTSTLLKDLTSLTSLYGTGAFGTQLQLQGQYAANLAESVIPGVNSGFYATGFDITHPSGAIPTTIQGITGVGMIIAKNNIAIGANEIIELLYNIVKVQEYAMKMNSYGFLNKFKTLPNGSRFRSKNEDSNYLGSSFQNFDSAKYKINNLFRPKTVVVSTENGFADPTVTDKSRFAIGGDIDNATPSRYRRPETKVKRNISAFYGALKFNFENQYGQLDGIKQVQMRGCVNYIDPTLPASTKYSTEPILAGDTYIGRYTEKCIMPIFTDFLNGQPDEFNFDYRNYTNIPYPRYWLSSERYDTGQLAQEIITLGLAQSDQALPDDSYYLDRKTFTSALGDLFGGGDGNTFVMKYAYIYTHISGISDFFVESEINLAYRDYGAKSEERVFDIYNDNDINGLLHADIVKEDNFYRYDYSLSNSRFQMNLISSGNIQPRDYDPLVADACHDYYPKRLIYSLRAQQEAKKDFWRVFLPNNYKDFKSTVSAIKPMNKTGAVIFFPYQSPQMFQGVDTLQTDLGNKVTVGDGGLFNREPQNITNSDVSHEYGSVESLRSIVNTPTGLFFMSQQQGKIFQYTGRGLVNIADAGMKWWFNKYLPCQLIKDLPELEGHPLADNPVAGVGCQTIYDANDDIVYFCKKDYRVKKKIAGEMSFDYENSEVKFTTPAGIVINVEIGDPTYFEDCSWTVSYDPKIKSWISFHDWHPEMHLHSINHFLTTKTSESDTPICPDGYVYNSTTGLCERGQNIFEQAPVDVDEIAATITGGPENCLVDIVIAMDVSGSTGTGNRIQAQRDFVQAFVQNPTISAQMASGDIQIGFTRWATNQISTMNPNGFSMSNTVTPAQVQTYYATAPGGSTNICAGTNGGAAVLADKSNSELGDRSLQPSFRNILIVMTDAQGNNSGGNPQTCGPSSTQVGCQYQNQAGYEVFAVFCDPTSTAIGVGAQNLLHAISCTQTGNEFIIVASNTTGPNAPSAVADAITSATCGTNYECECPTGYTLVYPNGPGGEYVLPNGTCDNENPPICRKVECECPPSPFPSGTTTESGTCDDLFLVGSSTYVNPTPKMCNYFGLETTTPSNVESGLWRHNYRCDLYSNFYGVNYPWEIELIQQTGQAVNTIRSVEYHLESYVYKGKDHDACNDDRWHDLDFNFDEAILYNSEQVSGLLKLNITPKEQPIDALQYPIINTNDIDILYSKEEQKYRFNQFWDITRDRGEFSNFEQPIFITRLNGYIKDLNANNLDYNKAQTQRKKLRHYYNKVLLRRNKSEKRKMLLRLHNTKLQLSYR